MLSCGCLCPHPREQREDDWTAMHGRRKVNSSVGMAEIVPWSWNAWWISASRSGIPLPFPYNCIGNCYWNWNPGCGHVIVILTEEFAADLGNIWGAGGGLGKGIPSLFLTSNRCIST
jgi:hypothetical protein